MSDRAPIRRVLIAIDFSDAAREAFHYGVTLAGRVDAQLYFLHVAVPIRTFDFATKRYVETAATIERVEEGLRRRLDELFSECDAGETVRKNARVIVRAGARASQEILDTAAAERIDMITIGSSHDGSEDSPLGSTAERVARRARCSVLVVREQPT